MTGLLTAIYRHLVVDRGKAFLLDFIGRGRITIYHHSPFQLLTMVTHRDLPKHVHGTLARRPDNSNSSHVLYTLLRAKD